MKNIMKTKYLIVILAVICSLQVFATQESDLNNANKLYKSADYIAAANAYEQIAKTYGIAPELYYNTGNAYYKAGEIGLAILNYERALRISPLYKDARFNLEFAQTKVVDNIVQTPSFFVKRMFESIIIALQVDNWYWISLALFLLAMAGFLYFIFGNSLILRRITFYTTFVVLILSVSALIFAGVRKNQLAHHNEAIIMKPTVIVKSSPDKSGTDLFQLHEGTKATIKSTLDTWAEIELGNGNIGWVDASTIERI
jgi:tetratricopeptide (TPR) repeat protein